MRFSLSFVPRHAALPLIVAAAYLAVASAPCPATPTMGSSASHSEADHVARSADAGHDATPSLVAPCSCGCDPRASGLGGGKREPGLAPALLALPQLARSFDAETAARLPDEPISVDTPVPIAA